MKLITMRDEKPKISVILPTHNRARLLGKAVQSVLNQTYQNFELIIVDDGSKDNTKKAMQEFTDPRIKYVVHQQNRGAAAARNTGIKCAKGKYIAFQDSDDEWSPNKLELQMEIFNKLPYNVDIIYTDMLRIKESGKTEYWHSPTVTSKSLINPTTLDYQVINIGIQSTLIKKHCFDEVGLFDENFKKYIDLELFLRLIQRYHFYHIKKPLVKYYATEGISSDNKLEAIAREQLLNKYLEHICDNQAFLANQYFMIGYAFQSNGQFSKGKKYIMKAFKTEPLVFKYLFVLIVSLFGQRIFCLFHHLAKKYYKILGQFKKSAH